MASTSPSSQGPRPGPGAYRRREPEATLLHQVVREHWKTLLAETAARTDGGSLPGHVTAEFERYLECGILAHGFARVRCTACGDDLVVAFSCKGRGFCPSCTTRRMQGTALHLTDRVVPHVPIRQWVLSLPRWARFLLARDPRLITRALRLALAEIFKLHRRRARKAGATGPRPGAITFVQRFGSALNLNVHFHMVVPDGAFVREGGTVRFVPLPRPTADELAMVLDRIARRTTALLRPIRDAGRDDARPPDPLAESQADSIGSLGLRKPSTAPQKEHTAYTDGFSLHAGVHLHANDRPGLAQLCGYGAARRSPRRASPRCRTATSASRSSAPSTTAARRSRSPPSSCSAASPRSCPRSARTSSASTASSARRPSGASRSSPPRRRPRPPARPGRRQPRPCPETPFPPRPSRAAPAPASPGPSCSSASSSSTCSPAPAAAAARSPRSSRSARR